MPQKDGVRCPAMKRALFALIALLFLPGSAFATWSVIAVDRATGRVVIASATCVDRDDQFLMGVQAVVVPGKGVAACQAGVDGTHKNQMLVFEELKKGTDPKRIIEMLSAGPGVPEPAVRHPRSAGPQRRPLGPDQRLRVAGHPGPGARHRDLLFDPGQHPARRAASCRTRCRRSSRRRARSPIA